MKRVKQNILHDPENGKWGNCFSAMLASLLHVCIDDIPVFAGDDWLKDVNQWLKKFGLAYINICAHDDYFERMGIKGCYHEIAGESPRFPANLHAVIGKDGRIVHDPHPDNTGVNGIEQFGFLVVLEPWKLNAHEEGKSDASRSNSL
jgi:hypothetical protein